MLKSGLRVHSNRLFLLCLLVSTASTIAFTPSDRSQRKAVLDLYSSKTPIPDGILKQVSTPGNGKAVNLGDIATVRYACYVSGSRDALPVARAERQKMVCLCWKKGREDILPPKIVVGAYAIFMDRQFWVYFIWLFSLTLMLLSLSPSCRHYY